jgi:hypothetical protein
VVDGVRRPNRSLADFIAPKGVAADHIGLFAVTAGVGVDKKERQFLADHDDYSAIMLKALADRLAEAFAERLHQRVRTDLWGYAADEQLSHEQLIAEAYRGIRPAPGYPACPDHSVKRAMFRVLQAADIGMGLTDSLAMTPAASVSGFYLAHPEARYFNVGRIGDDQLQDWAARWPKPTRAAAWPPRWADAYRRRAGSGGGVNGFNAHTARSCAMRSACADSRAHSAAWVCGRISNDRAARISARMGSTAASALASRVDEGSSASSRAAAAVSAAGAGGAE